MKELTIEQKAKAYDEAIKKAKDMLSYKEVRQEDIEYLFPELKESDDERIRKELYDFCIKCSHGDTLVNKQADFQKWATWLEKQGEQKTYGQREECLDCQMNYAGECKGSCAMKKIEQKPAWSEEDEIMYRGLHNLIYSTPYCDSRKELSDWLQSLKDRVQHQKQWKPTEEQMKALHDLNLAGGISYTGQGQVLIELYNDLKKL